MPEPLADLRTIAADLRAVVATSLLPDGMRLLHDADVVDLMDAAASIVRSAEALLVEAAAIATERSETGVVADRLTTAYGCRSPRELVQRVTRSSGARAGELVRAAAAVGATTGPLGDALLPPLYPALRNALAEGAVGADAVAGIAGVLDRAATSAEHRRAADVELAASARGDGAGGGGMPNADELRLQAQVWAVWLDPDGAAPRDDLAQRKRDFHLGRPRDGLVPVRGMLLPDVAATVKRSFDAILNPRAEGPRFSPVDLDDASTVSNEQSGASPATDDLDPDVTDQRTRGQKMHDAFATVIMAATRSGALPTLGGSAPTLLVSVRAEDLRSGTGVAHIDGSDEPVPLSVARQVACTGPINRVLVGGNGRIERIDVADRVFTPAQRRAITLRDGGCVIPGCDVPAAWCEIHHVTRHADGGPTHTSNGVLLCWHHHRSIDSNGWTIRMRSGIPEVRGPTWWDPSGRWRSVTRSPTRLRDTFAQRRRRASGGP